MFVLKEATTRGRGRITLAEIEAAVAARLGPGRVSGNAQPAAFSRQVAMYIASQVGGWSTTQIGRFYKAGTIRLYATQSGGSESCVRPTQKLTGS